MGLTIVQRYWAACGDTKQFLFGISLREFMPKRLGDATERCSLYIELQA